VVQKEIKRALDVLDKMPDETIYMIPARLEPCQAPGRLSSLHWVDLFAPNGFEKLKRALDFELSKREPSRQSFEPEMILIPAGEFLMGSDPNVDKKAFDAEQPQHTLYLPDYYMAKTPVTNAQYAAFAQATDKTWQPPTGTQDHPVVQISWHDAIAYCHWLSGVTDRAYRLPSEAVWEKAARGTEGLIYPWGNRWDKTRCNTYEGGPDDTTSVGAYPGGASPYGLLDMAGNVWEWTLSLWGKDWEKPDFKYPYKPEDGRENLEAENKFYRVLRGGSWYDDLFDARCALRVRNYPNDGSFSRGLRLVSPI
jgi:formylglycine-generating enzyme required for sulfatase activity